MDKLSEHAIRMLEIVDNERGFYKDMDGEVADIARAVYDVILQMQMLKMAERKVSEKSTGSSCSEKPNSCETCKHWWRSEDVCLLDDCQYEPTGDKLSPLDKEPTTDCSQMESSTNEGKVQLTDCAWKKGE